MVQLVCSEKERERKCTYDRIEFNFKIKNIYDQHKKNNLTDDDTTFLGQFLQQTINKDDL